ncbi:hypothetical protein [Priestia megaterium]|nr:hypothetical protein [Priestia megaterium]
MRNTTYKTALFIFRALFVKDAADIMMENGWMETPPEAVDRNHLNSN